MPARVGDRYRFVYDDPSLNRELTVVVVCGDGPDDLVIFDDRTHAAQKHLSDAMRVSSLPAPLPCPFCGAAARVLPQPDGYSVDCTTCVARVWEVTDHAVQAVVHWNKRTEPWISVGDRLPDDGDTVLVWEVDASTGGGRVELAEFKLTRRAWIDDDDHRRGREDVADPTFHWSGGDCHVEWRKSDGFAVSGGYFREEPDGDRRITHWRPLPAPPSEPR